MHIKVVQKFCSVLKEKRDMKYILIIALIALISYNVLFIYTTYMLCYAMLYAM